jgi:hypothetical protein
MAERAKCSKLPMADAVGDSNPYIYRLYLI